MRVSYVAGQLTLTLSLSLSLTLTLALALALALALPLSLTPAPNLPPSQPGQPLLAPLLLAARVVEALHIDMAAPPLTTENEADSPQSRSTMRGGLLARLLSSPLSSP